MLILSCMSSRSLMRYRIVNVRVAFNVKSKEGRTHCTLVLRPPSLVVDAGAEKRLLLCGKVLHRDPSCVGMTEKEASGGVMEYGGRKGRYRDPSFVGMTKEKH